MSAGALGYRAPLRDIQFVIEHWLQAPADWQRMGAFDALDADAARMVVEAAGQFCAEVLAPLNASGDLQGCTLADGRVRTPEGFAQAYRAYVEAGWPSLAFDPAFGGQGLPGLLDAALNEMLVSANHAWAMYFGILHGACACLRAHAPAWMQEAYLPQLVSGRWLATMCLTEPQAGSDLGLLRAQARPNEDGSYRIDGQKIFISGGDQDWTDNIVHLVLARLPDAPAGTKGISLFLVPRQLPLEGGALSAEINGVYCDGIEKKMGIKGSATCALRFENARGWLIGQPHRGLAAMFVMMNSARLHVGLQGLGHVEAASQRALAYAAERRQMRASPRPVPLAGESTPEADPILCHPPMRRILMDLRVWSEGMRALGYWAGHVIDGAEHAPELAQRQQAQQLAALLTPVVKALFTERGFELASEALQVFGGYGYIHEYGIEQIVRDSRIAMIYEGTNQIQALDLLARKALADGGQGLEPLLQTFRQEAQLCATSNAAQAYGATLQTWCERLQAATAALAAEAADDAELPARAAEDYLRLVGLVAMAFAWCRAVRVAPPDAFADKHISARYFFEHTMADAEHWLRRVQGARCPIPQVQADGSLRL